MLKYSDLTIVNNKGNPSALGIPINSMFLKNDMSLIGGGKKSNSNKNKGKREGKRKEKNLNKTVPLTIVTSNSEDEYDDDIYDDMGIPVGLACMTQTVCRNVNELPREQTYDHVDDHKVVPDDLYERLLGLAEESKAKKFTKKIKKSKNNKTKKAKGKGKK